MLKPTKIHYNSCDPITIIIHAGIRDDLYIQIVWEKINFETVRLNTTNSAIKACLQYDTYIGDITCKGVSGSTRLRCGVPGGYASGEWVTRTTLVV